MRAHIHVVILRPVEFNWAAIAALAAALTLFINVVMVRKLPKEQTTVHKLLLNYLLIIPAAGALAIWEGVAWDRSILLSAGGSAFFILGYNITVLLAYKQVDANQVTSAEYTGLIWAVLIGWIGFNEIPDLWFAVGSAMIVVPLILLGLASAEPPGASGLSGEWLRPCANDDAEGPITKEVAAKLVATRICLGAPYITATSRYASAFI